MTSVLLVHLACAGLVAADLTARTWRLRWLVAGAGHPMRVGDAVRCNLLADAGAAISPMRLAGEPARLAGMRLAGVPLLTALAAIGWELATAWPTLILLGSVLIAVCAPGWWAASAHRLSQVGHAASPAWTLIAILGVVSFVLARRLQLFPPLPVIPKCRPIRRMPLAPLLASVGCSAINVVSRTAVLPTLALTLPDPPTAAVLWLGSFLLVYGQLLFPTPSGLGAVELGYLGGAAGELGGDVSLLLAWRWWSALVPVLLGFLVAWGFRPHLAGLRRNTP
jgi:uncharacterized membrane protein YbhN (UPF0104 family)